MHAGHTITGRTEDATAAPDSRHRLFERIDLRDVLLVAATTLTPLVLLVPVLRLWRMSVRIPFAYTGDGTGYLMIIKNLITTGSYSTNASLGAPFGQQLYDSPQGADNLNLLLIRFIGLFTDDAALTWNLFYLLTYPLVALSAVLVLRRLGISRPAAYLCAVLFTLTPYHFYRGEGHLLLAAFWAVPLGAYLTLAVLKGESLFSRRSAGRRGTRWLSGTTLTTVAICVVISSTGLYYAFFTVVLVGTASLAAGAARRSRAVFLSGLAVVALLSLVLVVNFSPSIVYHWRHGGNSVVAARQANESEFYGLKLTNLVLPVQGHRIGLLARESQRYAGSTVLPENEVEAGQTLGSIGDVGFFVLIGVALITCVGAARWRPPALMQHASFAVLVAFLFGTVSGGAALFAYLVSPNIRDANRISVFIAFFSLLAVGVLIDAVLRRAAPGRRHWVAILALPLLAIGVADQTTNRFIPAWSQTKAEWDSDAVFGAAIDRALPQGSMVFQLPYVAFPESPPVGRMYDYDEAKPYLHTDKIRWSFGAMKGRPQDWAASLASDDMNVVIPAVAASGFSALYLDRVGYADNGASIETELRTVLGPPILQSPDGRYALYDLRRYERELQRRVGRRAMADARIGTLKPVRLSMDKGFYGTESNGASTWKWSSKPTVEIGIANPTHAPRTIVLTAKIAVPGSGAPLDIRYPDGTTSHFSDAGEVSIRRVVRIPAGSSQVEVATGATPVTGIGGDRRTLSMQFIDTRAVDRALLQLSTRSRASG